MSEENQYKTPEYNLHKEFYKYQLTAYISFVPTFQEMEHIYKKVKTFFSSKCINVYRETAMELQSLIERRIQKNYVTTGATKHLMHVFLCSLTTSSL